MVAFMPGQSPPDVKIPIFIAFDVFIGHIILCRKDKKKV
jgi:hypothetical protein